jgi:hypothetical protein
MADGDRQTTIGNGLPRLGEISRAVTRGIRSLADAAGAPSFAASLADASATVDEGDVMRGGRRSGDPPQPGTSLMARPGRDRAIGASHSLASFSPVPRPAAPPRGGAVHPRRLGRVVPTAWDADARHQHSRFPGHGVRRSQRGQQPPLTREVAAASSVASSLSAAAALSPLGEESRPQGVPRARAQPCRSGASPRPGPPPAPRRPRPRPPRIRGETAAANQLDPRSRRRPDQAHGRVRATCGPPDQAASSDRAGQDPLATCRRRRRPVKSYAVMALLPALRRRQRRRADPSAGRRPRLRPALAGRRQSRGRWRRAAAIGALAPDGDYDDLGFATSLRAKSSSAAGPASGAVWLALRGGGRAAATSPDVGNLASPGPRVRPSAARRRAQPAHPRHARPASSPAVAPAPSSSAAPTRPPSPSRPRRSRDLRRKLRRCSRPVEAPSKPGRA